MIKAIWESFCRALIRYFDGKAKTDDTIEYLRRRIETLERDNFQLQKYILENPKKVTEPVLEELTDWKPARQIQTWDQKRRELEQQSLERAQALRTEARIAIEASKTTEQLEAELGL